MQRAKEREKTKNIRPVSEKNRVGKYLNQLTASTISRKKYIKLILFSILGYFFLSTYMEGKYSSHCLILYRTGGHVWLSWFCIVMTLPRLGIPLSGTTHSENVCNYFTGRHSG